MAKTKITSFALAQKVIEAARQRPGCESVREISTSPVQIEGGEATRHVSIIDEGTARASL
jgi:hypothetical protein